MATRTAYLDYRERGASQAATGVRTLGDALGYQKRQALAAVPALRAAQQGTGLLGSVSQSSTAKIAAVSNSLGPFGAGLASIAREGPRAAQGLLMVVAQQERMGLLSRASNIAILGGATAMVAGGVAAVAYADNIIRGADAYSAMTSRIRMFSDGAVEAAQSERALFEMGRETRQGVEQLTTLYTRLTPAVADAGRAQADALQVTELTSKALLIQGANVREAEASTVQFAQALSSGVLRGDELRSLMESSPMLLRYIAQTLEMNGKIGVAFGQMRTLGEKGLLTTDKIMTALLAAAPMIERDFINAPKTAQQGWTVLSDTITRTIGQISQSTGMQASVVAWLTELSTKVDEFRKKALLDPDALAPAEQGIRLIGDALDGAGELAGGVVENFDLLLNAAEALIALKLGDIMVGWFSVAATKARETYTAVQGFRANGRFNAGAANDQVGAVAALQARSAAEAAVARASMLTAEADVKARMAVNARAAADAQATVVAELKARAGVSAAAVSQAEAVATNLSTVAERAETQAKAASTAATNAATAASARNVVAQEAEAAVTAGVTGAMAAKASAGRALSAVYGMLGGALGLVTIALGAVLYAAMQVQQAWEEKTAAMIDAVKISDELTAISNQLASATWAEVPALMAAAQAHREKAAAALEDARNTLEAERARRQLQDQAMREPGLAGMGPIPVGFDLAGGMRQRQAERVVAAAEADAFRAREEAYVARTRARVVEARARAEENRTGTDALGRQISASRRQENQRFVTEAQAAGRAEGERVEAALARQEAAARRAPDNRALANGVSVYRRSFEAASELSTVGQANVAAPRTADSKPAKKERMSAEDREALSLMERLADGFAMREMMGRDAAGSGRFRLTDDGISVDGTPFVAAAEDEARAALAYREQILAVMSASEDLVAQSGLTRQELVQQAADTLNAALANSQAAKAQEAWTAKMAEARGESTAAAQAQQEIDRAREQGARIAEDEARAYVALAVAKDKLRRAEEALGIARPVVQTVTRETLDDMGQLPETWNASTGAMGFDFEAAMRDWASARERILAESETRIREAMEAEVLAGTKTREEADAAVAAARLAVEAESGQQISELWRRLREEDEEAWRQRRDERLNQERELADSITGGLKDLAFGADAKDVGKRFMSDLLEAAWEELVSNPLNLAIRNWLRSLAQGQQTGQTGGFWSSIGSMFGGGGGGAGAGGGSGGGGWVNAIGSFVSSLFGGGGAPPALADGGLPGVRSLPPGLIEGQGGPRDDRILARVSRHEFISNAEATRKNLPILRALNAGWSLADLLKTPRFAGGGLPDDAFSDMLRRDVADAANERGASASPSEGRSGASGPNIDLDVNIINQTREPVSARVNRTLDGLDVILEPAVRSTVAKMGADGSLGRAGSTAPRPRRR